MTVRHICVPGRWRATGTATGVLGDDNFKFTDRDVREVSMGECLERDEG